MTFSGADKIELNADGDLLLHTRGQAIRMLAPVTYQELNGVRHDIPSRYILTKSTDPNPQGSSTMSVQFEIGSYDTQNALVIDPVLVYSTYLGGSGNDVPSGITVDAAGNAYVIGFTDSTNFPVNGALQPAFGGNPHDIFVSKLNPSGTALVYSTYLGGAGQDNGSDIAVDAAGNAYITGYTGSSDFPTANPLQASRTGFYNRVCSKIKPRGLSAYLLDVFRGLDWRIWGARSPSIPAATLTSAG